MKNNALLFILIFTLVLLELFAKQVLDTDELYISSLADQLTYDQIQDVLNF